MQRVALNSTLLQSAGYQDQLTLPEPEFRDGAVHHYFPVPPQTFQELLQDAIQRCVLQRRYPAPFRLLQNPACRAPAPLPDSDHGRGEMNLR
jgi:KTSC domain